MSLLVTSAAMAMVNGTRKLGEKKKTRAIGWRKKNEITQAEPQLRAIDRCCLSSPPRESELDRAFDKGVVRGLTCFGVHQSQMHLASYQSLHPCSGYIQPGTRPRPGWQESAITLCT
jgi:hypothetical protein